MRSVSRGTKQGDWDSGEVRKLKVLPIITIGVLVHELLVTNHDIAMVLSVETPRSRALDYRSEVSARANTSTEYGVGNILFIYRPNIVSRVRDVQESRVDQVTTRSVESDRLDVA